ncbi:hypothetical protein TrLO_g11873 [Triparma laevis f. longispina]|uniref:Uncharacterized protein n=1 Tax=Triparma laevis f. longispina TaxID=1714387 RepID=A0A9W7ARV9_9STRA|nr:hypothetical protein TrLO_g11873 [Triparma laevis f. longispina]
MLQAMNILRDSHAAVVAAGGRDPIPAASPDPAEPEIKVGDNILLKGKQVIITRIGTDGKRLEGYKGIAIDTALTTLADMRKNSPSDSDSLSALDKFLQEFGFLPGVEGEVWARSVWGGQEFQVDLNGEKVHKALLGPDVDVVNFVSDSETIKRLMYNTGGATMIRQSQPWSGGKKPGPVERSAIFNKLTSGSLVYVPKRCSAQASLVAIKAELERQQNFYKINKHMNYNKSDGSVHPHLSHKMFLKSKKPITEYKMRAVLDAADSLAKVVLVGMLHPLGDGGFFIVDAFKGGAEEINRRLQSKPNEIQEIEAIKSEIKSESEPHIDIALKALIPCCDDGTRNVVLFEKMGTPSPEKIICGISNVAVDSPES